MNLSHLSDQALLQQTALLVKREKEILSEILDHLEEVRKRRLFCDLGHGSLFQYCVKQLGYSEDQAYRRINALKIVKEVPAVRAQIASGELSLSSLSVAQSLFKKDTNLNKAVVLEALKNKSKREAEEVARRLSPHFESTKKEIKLSLSPKQLDKWRAVKAKLAHCNLSDEEILERLCDLVLAPQPAPSQRKSKAAPVFAPSRSSASKQAQKAKAFRSLSVPAAIRREIQKSNQCCNCKSRYALQIDHKIPQSLGGTHDLRNLRLLCRNCNQRAAIQILGMNKMLQYLEKS